jgi:hypothetical protein
LITAPRRLSIAHSTGKSRQKEGQTGDASTR